MVHRRTISIISESDDMLSIYKRENTYHIRGTVSIGDRVVKVRRTTGQSSKKQAEIVCRYVENTIINDMSGGTKVLPFNAVVDDWIALKVRNQTDRYFARRFKLEFTAFNINDINNDLWKEYKKRHLYSCKPSYINRVRGTLISIMSHAGITNFLDKEFHADDRIRFLSYDKQEELLSAYPEFIRPLFITLAYQGMRVGEAVELRNRYIAWDNGTALLEKTKNGRRRIVHLHPRVSDALQHLKERDYVFLNSRGERYASPKNLRSVHRTACKKAKVFDFTIHDWRHHWASTLMMNGANLKALMKLGGWSSERMVMRYADVSNEHTADTAKLMPWEK